MHVLIMGDDQSVDSGTKDGDSPGMVSEWDRQRPGRVGWQIKAPRHVACRDKAENEHDSKERRLSATIRSL